MANRVCLFSRTAISRAVAFTLASVVLILPAYAAEVTVKNDSITDFSNAVIVSGFASGEKAASWLTSPCAGNIRAVQVFWRSQNGTSANSIESAIEISRAGTFPIPGLLQAEIGGPVLADNAFNEYRFLDENNTIPLNVPVALNETFVVAFQFDNPPPGVGPSVVRDTNGILPNRNTILANVAGNFQWFNAGTLGVTGDWAIRAVVDCAVLPNNVDVSVSMSAMPTSYVAGQTLNYSIVVGNSGPSAANGTTIVDVFPNSLSNISWTCSGASGGVCLSTSGTGNIAAQANLPANSSVTYTVNSAVAAGTAGVISNSATAVVASGLTDTAPDNNTRTLDVSPAANALIFANGFE